MNKFKLRYTLSGKVKRASVTLAAENGRIYFVKMSPFDFKDEIKAMEGWKFDWDKKIWSIADTQRNHFQLQAMMGEPVYEPWEKPIQHFEPSRNEKWFKENSEHLEKFSTFVPEKLLDHQYTMIDFTLTRRYCNLAVEMGLAKSLSMIEVMELSGITDWFWVAPKAGMKSLDRELKKWKIDPKIKLRTFTYEAMREFVKGWAEKGKEFPQGVIFDECDSLANPKTGWTIAAQAIADNIRYTHGWNGMVVTMSGTTNAESPIKVWSQIEVTWPGFLREGSRTAFEYRLGLFEKRENEVGESYQARIGLFDDERKCKRCLAFKEEHPTEDGCKKWLPSVNEVALVSERLEGIQLVLRKEDCLDLPEKIYRTIEVKPSSSILRAARAMAQAAPNTLSGLNWLRQLSDGFAYKPAKGEMITCRTCGGSGERKKFEATKEVKNQQNMKAEFSTVACETCGGSGLSQRDDRETKKVKCPKDDALREILQENYNAGRIGVFGGFQGTIDRCEEICLSEGYDVFHVDGRGWKIKTLQGTLTGVDPLEFWSDRTNNPRVAYVAHPASGGVGLTLVEAGVVVYYSNAFNGRFRRQSEDRFHRIGCDPNKGVQIIDLIHLDSDRKVRDALLAKQRLEKMSLGILDFGDEDDTGTIT